MLSSCHDKQCSLSCFWAAICNQSARSQLLFSGCVSFDLQLSPSPTFQATINLPAILAGAHAAPSWGSVS